MDHMKKKIMVVSVTFATAMGGINAAESAPVAISGTFNVYAPCFTDSCTEAPFHVDTTVIGFFDPVAATFGISSNVTFPFGISWTAYDGTLFGPGTYTFSTINTATDVTVTVNPGEIGGHILWSSTNTSDIFLKWDAEGTSLDFAEDLDGNPGYRQVDGTVPNFSLSFDLSQQPTIVPVPSAVWLFGSGLLSLLGFGRIREAQSKNRS